MTGIIVCHIKDSCAPGTQHIIKKVIFIHIFREHHTTHSTQQIIEKQHH